MASAELLDKTSLLTAMAPKAIPSSKCDFPEPFGPDNTTESGSSAPGSMSSLTSDLWGYSSRSCNVCLPKSMCRDGNKCQPA